MADDVSLQFGAETSKLDAGVAHSREQIESIKTSVDVLSGSLGGLVKGFAAAFTVDKLTDFVSKMAELGDRTETVMARLGASAEQAGILGGIAKVTGTSLESLSQSIEQTALNVQRSATDAFSPQAQALRALGLRAKELIGLPVDQYFVRLADAVSKFNPSLNLTNILTVLGGRNIAQMIPALRLGGEGFAALQERIKQAQDGLARAIPGMADTHVKIALMGLSLQSFGARVFTVFKPAIDLAIKGITDLVQKMDSKTIQATATSIINWTTGAIISVGTTFQAVIEWIQKAIDKLGEWDRAVEEVSKFDPLGDAVNWMVHSLSFGKLGRGPNSPASAVGDQTGELDAAVKNFQARVPAWVEALSRGRDALLGAMSGGSGGGEHGGGRAAPGLDYGARNALESTRVMYEGQIALAQGYFAQLKVGYQRDSDMWQMTNQQKLAADQAATAQSYAFERDRLARIRDLWPPHTKEWEAANRQMLVAGQSFATEMIRINADMMRDYKQKWDEVFGALQGSFNGQLRGLLAGTTSWGNAFKTVLGDMLIYFVQMVEKMVFNWIAGKLAMAAVDKTQAGTEAATMTAANASTLPLRIAKFTSDLTAQAALAFAGVMANLSPILGPAAAGPAAAAQAGVMAQIANVPKYEAGTDYVPRTGLAMLHQGERVLTAEQNRSGGAGPVSISIQAWDGASVQRWLSSGGAEVLAKAVGRSMSNNPTLRPAY